MGASRSRPRPGLTTDRRLRQNTPAAVAEFAVGQLLRNDRALDALPAVLARLVTAFAGRSALALQPRTAQPPVVLAAYPEGVATDQALLTEFNGLSAAPGDPAADSVSLQMPLKAGGPGMSALLAYSAPSGGQCLCALALIGDDSNWNEATRSIMTVVATTVAAQIRHDNGVAELADQQALARTLIAGSPDAIVAADSSRRLVTFNPAAEELSGYRRDEVLGKEMSEILIPERERAAFLAHTEVYLATGDHSAYGGRVRVPLLRADGTERTAELTATELIQDGETYFCGFLRDLTELEHSQAALADTEARFRLLAQLAPVGIVQNDARGRAIFVNDRWCVMTGVPAKAALGADWLDLVHPDDRGQVERDMAVTAAREGEMRTQCRLRSADGGDLWVKASVVPLYAAGDGPLGFLATFTDITDAKRAEAERERLLAAEQAARVSLADQTERLNCLIATAIPGILITDEQGRITHVNQSFGVMFGIESPDQLVGAPAGDAVRQIKEVFTDPGEFVRRTSEAFSTRQPVAGEQMAGADGRTFDCDYWPVAVDGRDRGDLWLAWDVSDRKGLEEQRERLLEAELAARRTAELVQRQLEQQNEKLRELDETKTQFIATVSHELRTPLTSIVSFSELLKAETQSLTPDGAQFLAIIERNAHRLIRLVGDVLLLSHLESGSIPLELAPVSIPELTEEATRTASAGAAKRGVTVHFSADDGPLMQADRIRLFQVLDNLIANAIKFSRPNGLVRADAIWDGDGWRIDVADCGIGIPPNEVGQLFGRFVRGSNARTAGLPGTGLGLSVVKAIVELHGGRVVVDSALGRGTTFSVYLPTGTPGDRTSDLPPPH
jgi:PAS domain S-box-containing protein